MEEISISIWILIKEWTNSKCYKILDFLSDASFKKTSINLKKQIPLVDPEGADGNFEKKKGGGVTALETVFWKKNWKREEK